MNQRALVAMSGGVDSSVAAYLTKQDGFHCVGAMMKLVQQDSACGGLSKGCCSLADAVDARAVADHLGIAFYMLNFTECFEREVIARFAASYQSGVTPNPCADCNRYVKFDRFLQRAQEIACDYMVTGHYARITYDDASARYLLKKGVDETKDQSYVLYAMTQDQLARTRLPLGALRKTQVREIALEQGFATAKKRESQDICFVPDGNYAEFIEKYSGKKLQTGRFVDTQGNDLGEHRGIVHYTVGQRKGLGLAMPNPVYVCQIRSEDHTVVLGAQDALYAKTLFANDINLIAVDKIDAPLKVCAKIRYRQEEQPATVRQLDDTTICVTFDDAQRAITKGQAVVLYADDVVIGGGTITKVV